MQAKDFLGFLLEQPSLSLPYLFSFFLLGLMRVVPIVAFAPFLGSKLPGGVKIGLATSVTLILLPKIILSSHAPVDFTMQFVGYALKELFIGMVIAILCSIPFYIADTAGILIDFTRGSQSLMVQDPLMQTEVSPIGILYNYILIVIFFEIGGPFLFLDGVLDSYQILPVDGSLSTYFFTQVKPFWALIMGIINKMLMISIQIAAPCLVAVLMAEVFLGIANRLAPQIQIAFLGMSIKSLLAIGLLYAGWFYVLGQLGKQSLEWLTLINKAIRSFQL